jgi:hypothetical protein
MHVVKVHSAGHEIMEPCVHVPADLLVTQQPPAVLIGTVGLVNNALAVDLVVDVLALMSSGPRDIGDSLTITSRHCIKN